MVNHRHPRGEKGFSLIELIIVVVLIGVMVVMAIPSYSDFIANQRARTNAQTLLGTLMYARSEAIKINGNVSVTAAGGGWNAGWTISRGATVVKSQDALTGVTITEGAGANVVTYNGRGRLTGANAISFSVCDTSNLAQKRTVDVDPSGRPKVTLAGACP